MKVVTWQACGGPGARINICNSCAISLRTQSWPRHPAYGEYGQVYHGQHEGNCDLCNGTANVDPELRQHSMNDGSEVLL